MLKATNLPEKMYQDDVTPNDSTSTRIIEPGVVCKYSAHTSG